MSQYYDVGDETLWNPSNGSSRLFLEQLAIFEAEIGLPSGIGPMEADECQVDPAALDVFVNALLAWHRETRHCLSLGVAGVDWGESAGRSASAVRDTCRGQPKRRQSELASLDVSASAFRLQRCSATASGVVPA